MRGLALIGTLLLAGCQPSLGECDQDEAYTVVYSEDGFPAYLGQALVQSSCGNGGYCHSEDATGEFRRGAPRGLNWDVAIASTDEQVNEDEVARLRRGQRDLTSNAHLVWKMIDSETMPPYGPATEPDVHAGLPDWRPLGGGSGI